MGQQRRPRGRGPAGGALGDVPEDGGGAVRAAAAERAALHRGEVLRLIDDHVPEARFALDEVPGLIDAERVGERPARRPGPASRCAGQQQALFVAGEHPAGRRRQERRVGEQAVHQARRVGPRPDRLDGLADGPAAGEGAQCPVGEEVSARLGPAADRLGDPAGQACPGGAVAQRARPQLRNQVGGQVRELVGADRPPADPGVHGDRPGGQADRPVQRPTDHRRHPGVALERGHVVGVRATHGDRAHHVVEGAVPHRELPEGGQHRGDVAEEGAVGADDEYPGAPQLLAVGVEQIGGPVQPHGGLARPRGALDAHAHGEIRPDDLVLLGLDRRDDVAHRPGAGPLDLPVQQAAGRPGRLSRCLSRRRLSRRRAAGDERFVLERGELRPVVAEPASDREPHRVARMRPVERPGDLGAPVDDQRIVPGSLAHVPPPEVEALAGDPGRVGPVVDPGEEQRRRILLLGEAGEPPLLRQLQVGVRHLVHDRVARGDLRSLDLGPHPRQRPPAAPEVLAFRGQLRVRSGHLGSHLDGQIDRIHIRFGVHAVDHHRAPLS